MSVVFDPLVAWPLIWALAGVALLLLALALVKGLSGWALRGLALAALLVALANPSLQEEDRASLADIVILIVDESASQGLGDRPAQIAEAVARVEAEVAGMPGTELRVRPLHRCRGGRGHAGDDGDGRGAGRRAAVAGVGGAAGDRRAGA